MSEKSLEICFNTLENMVNSQGKGPSFLAKQPWLDASSPLLQRWHIEPQGDAFTIFMVQRKKQANKTKKRQTGICPA